MNERTSRLRKRLMDTDPYICPERAVIFTETMRETEGEPIVIRKAKSFARVLEKMSLVIGEDELIVGNQASKPKASPIYPEYSINWLREEFEGTPYKFDERPGDKFYYTEETKDTILSLLDYWEGKSLYENFRKNLPQEINDAWNSGIIDDTWVSSAGLGNLLVDFDTVLKMGLEGVIRKAEDRKARLDLTQPGAVKKAWFLEAVVITCNGVIKFAKRLSEKCSEMAAAETDQKRKTELEKMAQISFNVPAKPAQSFWEAIQSTWIILLALHLESNGHAISLGRFDQYINPFLEKDMKEGNITRKEALELVEMFYIKTNELNKLRSWPDTAFFLGYQMFVNIAVAGQTLDGRDAINETSHLVVEACENLRLFTPSVSIKVFEGTDPAFVEKAIRAMNNHKGGQPAFYNDDAFMKILDNMGIDKEDQHNWAPVGCIEAGIQGKWDYAAKGPWLNVGKVLEITLNGGIDPATGITYLKQERDLSTFDSMEELFEAYKKQLHHFMELQVITEHINDELHLLSDINAFRSSLVDDCIERGQSLIEGGSKYSADGGPTAGTITSADSLAALEQFVFNKKSFTGAQILHALKTDFEDMATTPTGEEIRQTLMNKAPRFGNDLNEADKWAVALTGYIGETYQKDFKNSRYGKGPKPCCYAYSQSPVTGNIAFGGSVGALPNGRKAGEAVNNGVSPDTGSEKQGPTAAINSVGKLPSIWFQKGAIFNVRLSENSASTDEGVRRIASLIKVLFRKNGIHIQFNVVGNETLREAQEHPENFRDLMVRVSGYSAFFTPLDPKVQEDIIKRVEFQL
ncbi:MAG TPA: pyruvate formate lyase family protein [Thermotogota bacterium]|nr:pyruvate formate lyase family protein [Thermotogota bacterium]HPJ88292.1 pyruvate formate lyase family protein [Thermotogota bacterium]HPR95361.1 pyruvate formate lyase family protein [Thermotogota bacterium]